MEAGSMQDACFEDDFSDESKSHGCGFASRIHFFTWAKLTIEFQPRSIPPLPDQNARINNLKGRFGNLFESRYDREYYEDNK